MVVLGTPFSEFSRLIGSLNSVPLSVKMTGKSFLKVSIPSSLVKLSKTDKTLF